jgi:CRP/FNR family cyclic AMP-dependent transcriptional regulator
MITTLDLLTDHPFLAGMPRHWLEKLSFQAHRAVYHPGYRIFHEGRRAERFWLIREGRVALDIPVPGRGDVVIEEIGPGTVLGWSWLADPRRWHFGAVAVEQTLAVEFDAAGVLRLCADDPAMGYELTRRFMAVLTQRLQHSRDRLLDIQGLAGPTDATVAG